MLNNWLELNMIVNSEEQEIICSYFNRYTLGNQIDNNHIKMYFDCNDKNKVEKQKKFAIPIASIIFLLIGAPLGIKMRRGNMAVSMAISLMFFILYYILIVGGEQLADKNLFNPILSMWLPNIIVFLCGILILKIKSA